MHGKRSTATSAETVDEEEATRVEARGVHASPRRTHADTYWVNLRHLEASLRRVLANAPEELEAREAQTDTVGIELEHALVPLALFGSAPAIHGEQDDHTRDDAAMSQATSDYNMDESEWYYQEG